MFFWVYFFLVKAGQNSMWENRASVHTERKKSISINNRRQHSHEIAFNASSLATSINFWGFFNCFFLPWHLPHHMWGYKQFFINGPKKPVIQHPEHRSVVRKYFPSHLTEIQRLCCLAQCIDLCFLHVK